MEFFPYRDGVLHAESVPVPEIVRAVGTPCYIYSAAAMLERYHALNDALASLKVTIFYAVKANSNQAVIATFARAGAGADVVSVGEMKRALAAGVPADKIIFSGVGKTEDELVQAVRAEILQINIESDSELEMLGRVTASLDASVRVALRVNPDVDAKTHEKITTGRKENKFGVDIERAPEFFARAAGLPGVRAESVAMHIGSQLLDLAPFRAAYRRIADVTRELRAQGHTVSHLDLGGGMGITYEDETPPDLNAYAQLVREEVGDLGCDLSIEPGRMLVGNAGILATQVLHVKQGGERRFLIADAAMNDLIRPTLYSAEHQVVAVDQSDSPSESGPADLVGPICESGDYLARNRTLPDVGAGTCLALMSAGAYGAVMSSTYNSRPLIPEVLVHGNNFACVRPRPSVEDLISQDRLPDWLS